MFDIDSYPKYCKDTIGGIKEIYVAPYERWTRSQIVLSENELVEVPATDFYLFETISNFNQSSDYENGAIFWNQSIETKLAKGYNFYQVSNLLKKFYRIIAKTNNGQYVIFGLYNGLEAKINNASGASKSDFNGFDVSFVGKENNNAYYIENLEDSNITIIDSLSFNYDLNLDF